MKATIRDVRALGAVRSLDLVGYLRNSGWQETQRMERAAFWSKLGTSELYEVLVPFEPTAPDYALRVAEVLAVLERAESRSQFEIIEDLFYASADVVRTRLIGGTEGGTISVENGKEAYGQARDLVLAAACAALEPRALYAKRKPEAAMRYLHHARFGIAEHGSYVLTIISPVAPRLVAQDLLGDVPPTEPFERRTIRVLAQALAQAAIAGRATASTGDFAPLRRSVAHGVSANLCEALVALGSAGGDRGVDFDFSWALTRGVPADTAQHVSIGQDLIPILAEAATIFRETGTQPDVEVVGVVQKLAHQGEDRGRATIAGTADGLPKSVTVDVSGAEHALAVRSYHDRRTMKCVGELSKIGRSWALANPRDFSWFEPLDSDSPDGMAD